MFLERKVIFFVRCGNLQGRSMIWSIQWRRLLEYALVFASLAASVVPASSAGLKTPRFDRWIDGTRADEPQTQTQRYDADTFVIRQSVRTNFEAPFLYLLFGQDRVLLIDTGAGGLRIRPAVDAAISAWLASHSRRSIPLVVAHSHSHGDHHAGDSEFETRPETTVIGLAPADVAKFFGIADWPRDIATFDLGNRALTIIPTPGHEAAHIMVYDSRTQLLFSGDMLYAGRLYVPADAFVTFRNSVNRIAAFAQTHPIVMVLGAHIEMTNVPGRDYPMEAASHPDEHPLALPVSAIKRLKAAVDLMADAPVISDQGDFIVYPRPPQTVP
jgi:glyoxylase-like metal-dependent hydrolase (beta-lactamase superfamily II)